MSKPRQHKPAHEWDDESIPPGEDRQVKLVVSESYTGVTVSIPLYVRRGREPGPAVFVTAALHGNEINGTGAVRALIGDPDFQIQAGTLVLVPVINVLGFDRHARYLPDGRDLNRCFPGSAGGSQASRLAHVIFTEIVSRCDYGIDLHTAAVRRTNYPNVRGDLSIPDVKLLAETFGSEYVVDGAGPVGSLRRAACKAGCPTIILEGGEVWKVEPVIVEAAVRGVRNVLVHLGMLSGKIVRPPHQFVIRKTKWMRADRGGFLHFHVRPGEIVDEDQPLATNASLLGEEQNVIVAPFRSLVMGMTTLPAVSPGEPVCHLGELPKGGDLRPEPKPGPKDDLHERTVDDLATNVLVVDPDSK